MKKQTAPHIPVEKIKEVAQKETVSRPTWRKRFITFRNVFFTLVAVFAVLAIAAHMVPYFAVDLYITHAIQQIHNHTAAMILRSFSWIGFTPQSTLFVAAISILLFVSGLRWEGIMSAVAGSSVTAVNLLLKSAVNRPRPSADLVSVFSHIPEYSFPSGHVMFYTVYFGYLIFLAYVLVRQKHIRSTITVLCAVLILGVAPSRIYMGQHWASDTVGAYLAGSIWLAVLVQIYYWGRERFFGHKPLVIS